jgi:hypothetical protein
MTVFHNPESIHHLKLSIVIVLIETIIFLLVLLYIYAPNLREYIHILASTGTVLIGGGLLAFGLTYLFGEVL